VLTPYPKTRSQSQIAFAIALLGVNNPAPALSRYGAAIAPRPTGSTELVRGDFPVFSLAGMMPESAIPVQHHQTIIEIRPYSPFVVCAI